MRRAAVFNKYGYAVSGANRYSDAAELRNAKPFSEIPKIPTVPILAGGWAYLPLIGKYKLTALHHACTSKYKEYGPIVREQINKHFSIVNLFEAEDIQKVFRNEGRYPYRKPLEMLKKYREERIDVYQSVGIFMNNGEDWYKMRSTVQPHMLKPKAVHAYVKCMDEVAREMIDRTMLLRRENGGEVTDYLSELYKWSLESVALVALDSRLGCLDAVPNQEGTRMISLVKDVVSQAARLEFSPLPLSKHFDTPLKKKFYKNADEFSELVMKYLNAAKKRLETKSEDQEATFLELLLTTAKDPRHLTTMVIDLLFAGTDTTSNTVGLTLYHLARNQQAQERAHQEVKKVLQEKGMCAEALNEIRYLKACVKESMRLTPVGLGAARTLEEDIVVRGYLIPAGTMIGLHGYVCGRQEKHFPDPFRFHPERFLREEAIHDPFAFLPFGFGPRSCVGRRFAEQEIWIFLMRMLERFRVEYRHGDVDIVTRLVSTPDKPLHFEFYDR